MGAAITAVLLGLIMVVRKVQLAKSFAWLISRYTWSVLAVVFFGLVFPVDHCIAHHNTQRVMRGDLLPGIFLFPVEECYEALIPSLPLMDSDDPVIRDGARAIFAEEFLSLRRGPAENTYRWTFYQVSRERLRRKLEKRHEILIPYISDQDLRDRHIGKFRKYTERWIDDGR